MTKTCIIWLGQHKGGGLLSQSISPREFVDKWRLSTLKERSAYQSHFIDLCHLIGHPTPTDLDPHGTFFTFEAGAEKTGGGDGFADVWKKGYFAWEYKGKHANLDIAYQQLLQYRESLQNPPLLVVCDVDRIEIHTNFTNSVKRVVELSLDDLLDPHRLEILKAVFNNPGTLKAAQTTEQVTRDAAAQFARMAKILADYGEDPEKIAHFLIRLLFILFAEDVGLLPLDIFSKLTINARLRPQAFSQQVRQLFASMATGGWFGAEEIAHFDGRLFDDDTVLEMDSECLDILAEVSYLDWASIEPSIFGTLFERSLDPSKRSQLGAHYTSKDDILLIVEPVLMAPMRRRWEHVQAQVQEIAARRNAVRGGSRTKWNNQLSSILLGFAQELAEIQILDPACGSGNFLYVALRQLLDLWKEVSTLAGRVGLPLLTPLSTTAPSPEQLHGIEINAYAHQLAQATIWIGYIQWLRENGYGSPPEPILKPLNNIIKMDAILEYDSQGNPREPEWPRAEYIIGNPPFLGDKKMRSEFGDKYVDDLRTYYSDRLPGQSDLVCYWFEKGRSYVEQNRVYRVGLLATNSIRSGENRVVLDRIKEVGDIFMAWSDRPWILDGAAVRVSMIGFDRGNETIRFLDGKQVTKINPDLTSAVDVTIASPLNENKKICFLGMMKAGPFDIDAETAGEMIEAPVNPNGRPNSDVVKKRLGGQDITGRDRDTWIIDFGIDTTEQQASLYQIPYEFIRKNVKPLRDHNRRNRLRIKWWIHGEPRPGLRMAIKNLARCIVTPEVSKHRIFAWIVTEIIPDHKLHVFARDDDYFFGVLHSRIHEIWSLAQCSWIGAGNDPSYSSTRTFETFPIPWHPGQEPVADPRVIAIAQAAKDLVDKRDIWLNPPGASEDELKKRTLTNLYNQRPTWLDLAHRKLDEAVFAAYGWPPDLTDEQILVSLLELNLKRSARQVQ